MTLRVISLVLAIQAATAWGIPSLAETAEVTTTDRQGGVTSKTYALQEAGPGVLRLKVPLQDIRPDRKSVV